MNDKGGNLLTFNASGYLISMKDNNNNTLTISYSGSKIQSVTDGAGRVTNFTYDANGNLAAITDPAGRKANYSYSNQRLWRITYVDAKYSEFNYDLNNNLTSVTNIDGYRVSFTYYDASPFRVKSVQEGNAGGSLGQELNITYGNNATIFTDFTGRKNIYQFNDNGNTVSIIDSDGRAQYFRYNEGIDERNKNKLRLQSKFQKTTINYIKNHNLEKDSDWITGVWGGNIGSQSITTEDKYLGTRALKITSTSELGGRDYQQTGIVLEKGKTYTLSAYVKTNGISLKEGTGAAIAIGYRDALGNPQYLRTFINGTKNWDRYELTFTIPSDAQSGIIWVSAGIFNSTGTVYFDCFQLEEGTIANRYNLIENSDFSYGSSLPAFWDAYGTLDASDTLVTEEAAPYSQPITEKSFRIIGGANKAKGLSQKLNIAGKSGDVYVLGGWSRAQAVPLRDNRAFNLSLRFEKPTGEFEWHDVYFNLDSTEWQYVSERIVAESDYVSVTCFIKYDYNVNTAYFDGLQLYKEEFGVRYQYDDKGNLVSTVDLAGQTSTLQYNANDDLTKAVNPDGSQSTFNYDSRHNLLSATFAGNVAYSFTYDGSGNVLSTRAGDSSLFIKESSTYTQSQNYIKTITDSFGYTRTYNYDEVRGMLTSELDEKNKATTYIYDNLDRLTSVSKFADGQEVKNSYNYENDKIKKITHNGFSYNFSYDSLGNLKTVDVAGQKLLENIYIDRTDNVLQVDYPNGGTITNIYDDLDRLVERSFNGIERYRYNYDAAGNLAYQEDLVINTKYRYIYDLSDRLSKIIDSRKNITSFEYNLGSNISKITEQLNEAGVGTISISYEYSQDNKQTKITLGNNKNVSYIYDALGRLTSKTINTVAPHTTTFSYAPGVNGSTTNRISKISNNGREINYTYDEKGNIKTITENGKQILYYYNELDELIQEDNQVLNKTVVYSYDVGGNLKSKLEIPYGTGGVRTTIPYSYDPVWKDKLISYNGKPITYDEIGNPLTYDGWTFRWEEGKLLAQMTNQSLDIWFNYNDRGIRTEKRVNGVSTRYHLIDDRVTFETNGTDKIYYSYDSKNKLISMNLNGVEYYYVRNAQDDIIGLIDDSGNLVVSYVYGSWGKIVSISGTLKDTVGVKNPYRYRGYRYDNETGLYYLQSRYYNAEWGRFINADDTSMLETQKGHLLGANLFVYCSNNPVNFFDPYGYASISTIAAGAIIDVIMGLSVWIAGLFGSMRTLSYAARYSSWARNSLKSMFKTVSKWAVQTLDDITYALVKRRANAAMKSAFAARIGDAFGLLLSVSPGYLIALVVDAIDSDGLNGKVTIR